MIFFLLLSSLFVHIQAVEKDLEIIMEYLPDECDDYAMEGDHVYVDYTGMFEDGHIFDTSDGQGAIKFDLGSSDVIKGWNRGIIGMCLGEHRKLIIPPHLGYGDKGVNGIIPGGATLLFEVHLHSIERDSPIDEVTLFLSFAVWPTMLSIIVYYCYNRMSVMINRQPPRRVRVNKKKR